MPGTSPPAYTFPYQNVSFTSVMIPAIFCALLGLAFGSFLNVCITRIPLGESVVWPSSHCRQCGRDILKRDNIPLLSWIVLRGRCRFCTTAIPWRYLFVEIMISALFLMCWFRFGLTWQTIAWALFCFLVFGLAVMDAETMLLPNRFTLSGLVLGIVVAGVRGIAMDSGSKLSSALRPAGTAILDAGIAAGLLLLVMGAYWLVRRRAGMGMGDVKLLAMLAAWLGLPQAALLFTIASVFAAAFGLGLMVVKKERNARMLSIPFGTFLCLGSLYCVFLGERTLRWYMQFFG